MKTLKNKKRYIVLRHGTGQCLSVITLCGGIQLFTIQSWYSGVRYATTLWWFVARYVLNGVIWYGMVWCGVVWCGMVWCGMVRSERVWCSMVEYGMVWYDAMCYRMVL